jgi:hypothetical protein
MACVVATTACLPYSEICLVRSTKSLINPGDQSSLTLAPRCLAVFVDDTGHEDLAKTHKVYGLGGCAALGRDIERLIHRPWKELRQRIAGAADAPLHAHKFPTIAKPEDFEAVAQFFRAHTFWRFGAVFTIETTLLPEITRLQTMKGVLERRIDHIVQMTLCKEVKIVFESSERMDARIEGAFQALEFFRGEKRIPTECGFMPKTVGEPALEVADFVMHAIGRQARHNLTQRGSFLPDFCAIFHGVDPKFTSFMEVEKVVR